MIIINNYQYSNILPIALTVYNNYHSEQSQLRAWYFPPVSDSVDHPEDARLQLRALAGVLSTSASLHMRVDRVVAKYKQLWPVMKLIWHIQDFCIFVLLPCLKHRFVPDSIDVTRSYTLVEPEQLWGMKREECHKVSLMPNLFIGALAIRYTTTDNLILSAFVSRKNWCRWKTDINTRHKIGKLFRSVDIQKTTRTNILLF